MAEWNKYKSEIKQNLITLSFSKKVNFALKISKDLVPDYIEFENSQKWGDSAILKRGIEILDDFIKTNEYDLGNVGNTITELKEVMPHTDDFGEIDGSLALNASSAIYESLTYLVFKQDNALLNIASYAYHSIETKLWELNPKLSESEIANHETLISEMIKVLNRTKNVV